MTNSNVHSRRQFLKTSTAAVVTGAMAVSETPARGAYVNGSDVLRVGLIGAEDVEPVPRPRPWRPTRMSS